MCLSAIVFQAGSAQWSFTVFSLTVADRYGMLNVMKAVIVNQITTVELNNELKLPNQLCKAADSEIMHPYGWHFFHCNTGLRL